jgi:putative inorganic carbon (HCO3(-)) transporter
MRDAPAFERFLFYGFLALLFWLPLSWGSNRAWSWSLMEIWTALISLCWLLLYARGRLEPSHAFRAAWPVLLVLGLLAIWIQLQAVPLPDGLLQWLSPQAAAVHASALGGNTLSLERHASRVDLGLTVTYLQIFALTLLLINSAQRVRLLITVVVLCGVLQASYGTFMTLSGLKFDYLLLKDINQDSASGTYINRNHLAGYLEMTLALGIGLLVANLANRQRAHRGWRDTTRRTLKTMLSDKVRLRIYLMVMVIGLVMTRSRMGNSAFFISLTVAALYWVVATGRLTRATALLFGTLLLVDIWVVGNFFGVERVVQRLQQTNQQALQPDEVSFDTLAAIGDYPLTGTGAGSFYAIFPLYQRGEVQAYYDHAHNDYAEFAVELGLPAVALLGSGVLLSLGVAFSAQRRRQDNLMKGLGLGAGMGMLALLIHSSVDFNLQIPANAAMFMVLMALAWVSRYLPRPQRQSSGLRAD